MGHVVGSGEWLDHVTHSVMAWLVGVEVYQGGWSEGRTPLEDEDSDRFYIGILISTPPLDEFAQLNYEDCFVRVSEKDIYELRFSMKYPPELRNWLHTLARLDLTPPEAVMWSEEYYFLYKPTHRSVFIFEPE